MIVQVGPYPDPIGGVSIYIKRMKEYLDHLEIDNEVWDISSIKKRVDRVSNIRLRYVPLKLLLGDVELVHYNICGIGHKLYIGVFNRLLPGNSKKVLTIHGESRELFSRGDFMAGALNSFDRIICVKAGDGEYLYKKGVKKPVYEIPTFIPPANDSENIIPEYILDFIKSKSFVITANASNIEFYNNCDLYGIDMSVMLLEKLKLSNIDAGVIFFLPNINNIEYFEKLNNMIREKKLEHSFIFVKEKMEMYPVAAMCQLFIRPTCSDGYGVSIAEAIFENVPAIASDVCQRPQGTIVFKSRDLMDLYDKTVDVVRNYKDHEEKIRNIKFPANEEKILEIYKTCLKERKI